MTDFRRIALRTGVTLNVAFDGDPDAPSMILLHGFPESHRTWRELASRLADSFRLIMPDQRGFAGSDRPREVSAYKAATLVDDVFALAGALALESFFLVGHDWGGAIAWSAGIRGDSRLRCLAIINAPHPVIFQKSLIESEDQRAASQYINAFKAPGFESVVEAKGFDWFFDKTFGGEVDLTKIPQAERQQYFTEWSQPGAFTAMLNWYRASQVIVPPPGLTAPLPDWLLKAFAVVKVPTLVLWGMKDTALLPLQLDGLGTLVEDLAIVRLADAGHFGPWESPDAVADALRPFLAVHVLATAAPT